MELSVKQRMYVHMKGELSVNVLKNETVSIDMESTSAQTCHCDYSGMKIHIFIYKKQKGMKYMYEAYAK